VALGLAGRGGDSDDEYGVPGTRRDSVAHGPVGQKRKGPDAGAPAAAALPPAAGPLGHRTHEDSDIAALRAGRFDMLGESSRAGTLAAPAAASTTRVAGSSARGSSAREPSSTWRPGNWGDDDGGDERSKRDRKRLKLDNQLRAIERMIDERKTGKREPASLDTLAAEGERRARGGAGGGAASRGGHADADFE
jgi:hypothetical protein